MKKISAVLGLIGAIGIFLLGYLPLGIALAIYAGVGILIGAFWNKAKNWAIQGMYGLIYGLALGVFLNAVLPSMLSRIQTSNSIEHLFFENLPFLIKVLIVWLAVRKLMRRFRKTASAFW